MEIGFATAQSSYFQDSFRSRLPNITHGKTRLNSRVFGVYRYT
jgi:hypothetical protein